MATTFVEYTGDGNATKAFTFPSLQESDVKVRVDGVLKTTSTHYNITSYTTTGGGNVVFTSGNIPSSPANIRIYRDTNVDTAKATFTAGSSVKAADLNDNTTQLLYRAQEEQIPNLIHSYDIDSSAIETSNVKDSAVTTAKIAADAVTNAKIADDQIDSEHYVDGSIDTQHIADAQITHVKLANDCVDADNIQDDVINSEHYAATSIDTEHIANEQVTTAKLAADAVTAAKLADNAVVTANIVNANITHAKLANDAVDGDNIADDSINSEHYVDGSIDTAHIADSQITTAKIAADAVDGTKIADDSINSEHYVDGSIDTAHIADAQITTAKIADGAITDAKIAGGSLDNRYYTETELDAGQLDNRYYTETESDARYFNISTGDTIKDGDTFPDNDTTIATTAAINDRIIDLVDDVGGFVPIANETSFPTANPDVNNGAGTLVSIKAISSTRTPSTGTVTIANGSGSNTVTITGCGSTVLTAGFGVIVETTNTTHTYAFHRLVPKATEVTTVAGISSNITTVANNTSNINAVAADATDIGTVAGAITNVNNVGGSISNVNTVATNISNVNTVASNDSNITAVAGNSSNINSAVSNASNINSAVSNASNINSAVSNASNINTVAGSISNVNTTASNIANVNTTASNIANVNNFAATYQIASSAPSTDGAGNALAAGDLYFDTSSNELRVHNGTSFQGGVTASGSFASSGANTFTGNQTIQNNLPKLLLTDANNNSDFSVQNANGVFTVHDETNSADRLTVNSAGLVTVPGNLDANGGIDVTGNITVSGNVDGRDVAADGTKLDGIASSSTANPNAIDNVVEDTTPQLGGALDVNGHDITSTSNGNIDINPHGSGLAIFLGNSTKGSGAFKLNCEANSHGITIKGPPHSAGQNYTLTFPSSLTANGVLTTNGSGTLSAGLLGTANIAGDAVDGTKIADDSIDSEHYVDGSIDTAHIADQAVDLSKLPHGTSSNDGKFLRANNGADPTFETVDLTTKFSKAGGDTITGDFTIASGTTNKNINVDVSDKVRFDDNLKATFGNGDDLQIFHNGNNSFITDAGTGDLYIQGNNALYVRSGSGENKIVATSDGAVALYNDGSNKLATTSSGIDVTGNIVVSGTVDGIDIATDVAANTAKVTNATHTGEVTGATTLTIANDAVTTAKIADDAITTATIADDAVTSAKIDANPAFTGTTGIVLPIGDTSQRATTQGLLRFNTTTGLAEYYNGTSFIAIDSPPTLTSISPTEVASAAGGNETFTLSGSNFKSGAVVKFISNTGTEITASTVTVNSSTSISAVIAKSSFVNGQEPYDVKVVNSSGLQATLADQINVDNSPSWSTSSGSLGSISEFATGNHFTVAASDADGDTVAYSLQSGSLGGLSLNSSTGVISGDPTDVNSDTTNSFTLRATAGGKTADRSFSYITTNVPTFYDQIVTTMGLDTGDNLAILVDPMDPSSDSGSGTITNRSGRSNVNVNITLNGLSRGGSGTGKYWQADTSSNSYLNFGNNITGVTNNSTDSWAYCGWWRPTFELDGGSGVLWCLNDGDWSPYSQIGVRVSQGNGYFIHSGGSHSFINTSVPSRTYTNNWYFLGIFHYVGGGTVIMQGLAGDTNLTEVVFSSQGSSTGNASGHNMIIGARPDDLSSDIPDGTRMGPQAAWYGGSDSFVSGSSISTAKSQFESIFDATKGRF